MQKFSRIVDGIKALPMLGRVFEKRKFVVEVGEGSEAEVQKTVSIF